MDIKKIWKNKSQILEGVKNNIFTKEHVEEIYNERLSICKTCPHYDPKGESERAYVKGSPSCRACGCPLATKLRSLSTECGKSDLGEKPLWGPITDEETEDLINTQINKNK